MKIIFFEAENLKKEAFASLQKNHEVRYKPYSLSNENFNDFSDANIISISI